MNTSKIRDPRMWTRWREAGAVATSAPVKKCSTSIFGGLPLYHIHEAEKWLNWGRKYHLDKDKMERFFTYCLEQLQAAGVKGANRSKPIEEKLERLLCKGYQTEAKRWLDSARKCYSDNSGAIAHCRKFLDKARMTLSSIGSSEEEMSQLLHEGYIAEAKLFLILTRGSNRDKNKEGCIEICRKYLSLADLTLESIGGSEEEMGRLLHEGYIAEAKEWLDSARKCYGNNKDKIVYCRQSLVNAGVTLESIGGSEEEMSQLLHKGYIAEVKKYLRELLCREATGDNTLLIKNCRLYLSIADAAFESIGCSEEAFT